MPFRPLLRWTRRRANRAFEELWSLLFAALGRIMRSQPAAWSSPGGQKVLVVAPHPDDEAVGCAGTIVRHVQAGDAVTVAIITDGRRSRVIPDPEAMAAQRQREARLAASLMEVDRLAWLGHPEGGCSAECLKPSLLSLLEDLQPDVIYAPSRIDFHPEHVKVAQALALALADSSKAGTATIRIYQIQVPLTPAICNRVNDVSSVAEQCEAVLAAYTSQTGTVQGTMRLRRYGARLHRFPLQAEEFWEIPARSYTALHSLHAPDTAGGFRGLRNFSLSDPLAYLVGRAERRRLRSLA